MRLFEVLSILTGGLLDRRRDDSVGSVSWLSTLLFPETALKALCEDGAPTSCTETEWVAERDFVKAESFCVKLCVWDNGVFNNQPR